jgi:hypothetical protein
MRKLILALALSSAALGLAGCQTVHNIDTAVALANQDVGNFTIADEKGWYYAEALYTVPTQAYLSVNSRGLFAGHPDLKATIKADLQKLNGLRQAVYQAYKTANAVTFREKLAGMKALSDQVRGLIPTVTSQASPAPVPSNVLAARVAAS